MGKATGPLPVPPFPKKGNNANFSDRRSQMHNDTENEIGFTAYEL